MSTEGGGPGNVRPSRGELARGGLVLAAAVAIGALLLGWAVVDEDEVATTAGPAPTEAPAPTDDAAQADGGEPAAPPPVEDEEAVDGDPSTDAPAVARQPGEVRVLVLNGTGGAGVAARGTRFFTEAGYLGADPGNAPEPGPSAIYYAEGYALEAGAAAAALGLDPAQLVKPLDAEAVGDDLPEAHLVVVAGTDGVVSF